jgi:hypothetical protein
MLPFNNIELPGIARHSVSAAEYSHVSTSPARGNTTSVQVETKIVVRKEAGNPIHVNGRCDTAFLVETLYSFVVQ